MSEQVYAYPFDPTGTSQTNLVPGEMHSISPQTNIPPDYPNFFLVIPEVGPFFEDNLKIEHFSSNGTRELILGVDYYYAYHFVSASRATGKRLYGAIAINNMELTGALRLSYQTIGGPWTINLHKATQMLANVASNPRITTWESVVELPHAFPVIDHEWHLDDMVGMTDVVEAVDRLTDAIDAGGQAAVIGHINAVGNVHGLTPEDINLGNLPNYPVATYEQIDQGHAESLVTPHLLDYKFNQMLHGEGSSAITSQSIAKSIHTGVRYKRIALIDKNVEEMLPYTTAENYPALTLLISNTGSASADRTNVDIVNVMWRPGYIKAEHTMLLRTSSSRYFVRMVEDRPELWMRTDGDVSETTIVKLSDGHLYTLTPESTYQMTEPLGLVEADLTSTYINMDPYATYGHTSDMGMAVVSGISEAIISLNQP